MYHASQNYYFMCKTEGCFLNTHFVSESEVDAFNTRHGDKELIEAIEDAIDIMDEEPAKDLLVQALAKLKP